MKLDEDGISRAWTVVSFVLLLGVIVAAPAAFWGGFTSIPAIVCAVVNDEDICPLVTPHPMVEHYKQRLCYGAENTACSSSQSLQGGARPRSTPQTPQTIRLPRPSRET